MPIASATNPLPHTARQTSRTLIIGLGDFGLEVVALLLPRLEVHRRFVLPEAEMSKLLTRCGLIAGDAQMQQYAIATMDNQEHAFANVREIQHYILQRRPDQRYATISEALHTLLQLEHAYQPEMKEQDWLLQLARPIIADLWRHASDLAHLHVFLPVSIHEDIWHSIPRLSRHLHLLHIPVTLHILVTIGDQHGYWHGDDCLVHQYISTLQQDIRSDTFDQKIFIIDHSKSNQTHVSSAGESAMMVCNYLDTCIFSTIGDTLSEQYLADQQYLQEKAPYGTIGAAKMYVPIAEVSSDIVARSVARLVQERIQQEPHADQVKIQQNKFCNVTDLAELSRVALRGLPIKVRPRQRFWQRSWNMMQQRLHRQSKSDADTRLRQQFLLCPRLTLNRSYLRHYLRNHGPHLSTEQWWGALQSFSQYVEQELLGEWCKTSARYHGIALEDEQLVLQIGHALTQDQSFMQGFHNASPEQQAQHLSTWVVTQRPDLAPVQSSLEATVERELFSATNLTPACLPTLLPTWLRTWFWQQHGGQNGYVGEVYTQLREGIVDLIAHEQLGLKLGVVQLKAIEERYQQTQSALKAWKQVYEVQKATWIPINPLPQAQQQQATQTQQQQATQERWKQKLITALRHQPYPSALFVRLLLIWLIPLYVVVMGIMRSAWMPPTWMYTHVTFTIVSWTVGIILLYTAILLMGKWRIWRAKRRLEDHVLDKINVMIEQAFYDDEGIHAKPGIIPTCLRTFENLVVKPAQECVQTPDASQSLLATLADTVQAFSHYEAETMPTMPACVVYHSVAYDEVRQALESKVYINLDGQPAAWGVREPEVRNQLTSAQALTYAIKQAITTLIMQQYLAVARVSPELKLHNLLKPPVFQATAYHAYRAQPIDVEPLVSDMQLRAKPFLDLLSSQDAYDRITILSASTEAAPLLLSQYQKNRKLHMLLNQTRDPFGLGYTTIVHGLTQEALPKANSQNISNT